MGKKKNDDWITSQKLSANASIPDASRNALIRKILTGVTVLLLVVIIGYAANATANKPAPLQLSTIDGLLPTGTMAPNFTLNDIDGKAHSLSDYRGQKVVLIEFFSTRCPHCQASVPYIEAIYEKNKDHMEILSVNAGDGAAEPSTAPAFRKQYGVTYPILDDPPGPMLADYKLEGFPTFYLVDRSGKIIWAYTGEMNIAVASVLGSVIQ